MDDITILTYSSSTAQNSENLRKVYEKCIKWAKTHGSKFNPEKSELIHFLGRKRGKNRANRASINLEGSIIEPSKFIKVLGAYLDENLSPNTYLRKL